MAEKLFLLSLLLMLLLLLLWCLFIYPWFWFALAISNGRFPSMEIVDEMEQKRNPSDSDGASETQRSKCNWIKCFTKSLQPNQDVILYSRCVCVCFVYFFFACLRQWNWIQILLHRILCWTSSCCCSSFDHLSSAACKSKKKPKRKAQSQHLGYLVYLDRKGKYTNKILCQ